MKHQLPNPNRKNAKLVNYDYLFAKSGNHVAGVGNRHQRRAQFVNPKLIEKHEEIVEPVKGERDNETVA